MEPGSGWEMLIVGILVVLVLLWMRPGIRESMRRSREATRQDWSGLLVPLLLVVLLVVAAIALT